MKSDQPLILVIVFLLAMFVRLTEQEFIGTYGINYGRIANNIPPPNEVVKLLRKSKIRNVRIYDADHSVLEAFTGTGLQLVIGLNNGLLQSASTNASFATSWVRDNVLAFLPKTSICGIAVGNEVLGDKNYDRWRTLLGATKNIYNAVALLGLDDKIQITTAHSQAVFANSYPPSSCVFASAVVQYMKPLLEFFSEIGSPFCLNAYPFLAYMGDPDHIDINFALFEKNKGFYDNKTNLHYDNMLDAQIDAAYAALKDAGFGSMEVIVTETGWASHGDANEEAASVSNARTYNYNLRKRLAKRKGTPFRPHLVVKAYVFAMFNENLKQGPKSEKNYGLFKHDGSISYKIGFHSLSSSTAATISSLRGVQSHPLFTFNLLCWISTLLLPMLIY